MATVFAGMGMICGVLASLGLLAMGASFLVESLKNLYITMCYRAEEIARRDVGTRLVQESYWFSEDEATMAALEIIGRNMSKNGYTNVSECRDEWRKRKGKASK